MPAEQRIQIKRRASEPSSTSAWQGLLDGELGYIKNTNKLYIGNGKGVAPTLISTLSWDELTGKPTSILSQIYLNSTDPTKIVYKKVGNNTEYTLGNFAPLTNGLIDLKYLPQGALERLVVVANATARLKLTTANVQLGDTVKETDTGLMYVVVDESKLNSEDGYQVYVAGRAAAVDWTGIENKVNATVSSAGLMSAADKKKLDNTNVAYGTCSTAASTTQKDIVITSQGNWSLQIGSIIVVKFTYTNTAQNPVFKVGNAAAKSVWYNTALISTSNLSYAGYANRPSMYMYDGTQFVWLGWTVDSNSNTKVTQSAAITTAGEYPVLLGYGTATTAVTDTVNKAAAFTYNPNTKILTAETFKGKLTGNADTATILKNARTLTIGNTGKTFNGSANVSWTLAEIGAVAKAGDTMTGFLTLHANPTANLHAATKQYVDTSVENAAKLFTTTTTITTDTASSVVFDTSTVTLSTCLIYYNGLLMTPGVNYSITNNTTIALSGWTANKGDIFTVSGKQANETTATQAIKLTCGNVGSSTKPVYFENGIPVECSKSIGEGYLPLSGGTITGTSGDTPLYLKSASTATWLGFKNSSGTNLGFFGFSGSNIPAVYLDKTYKLLHDGNYNSYSPTLTGGGATGTWGISINGSAATLSATLSVDKGGTGQTTARNAANAFMNALETGSSTPVDADYYISQYVGGGTTTTTYYRRPMSALWSYINGKVSASYPTKTGGGASGTWGISISGNAATATSATKATQDGNGATIASTYLKLAGGTMTGNITRKQVGQSWIDVTHGRACAIKLSAAASGGAASCLWSVKTNAGAWGCGGLSGNDNMYFSYGTDTNYNAYTNTLSGQITFTPSGGIVVASNTEYTTYKARNIAANTSALTSGSSSLASGNIYVQYE